jgi:uncharacterized repeat protein (TIGR03803 family)
MNTTLRNAMRWNQSLIAISVIMVVCFIAATAATAQSYSVLYNLGNVTCDPINPQNSGIIAQGRDGDLYSTTAAGGCHVNGAAFKITPAGKLTVVYSFNRAVGDQIFPPGGLTLGSDGNYWGTNIGGGFGPGNVFKLTAAGKETVFNVFGGTKNVNGNQPTAPPVQGMDGNFYGATNQGGNVAKCTYNYGGCGVIYKITPSGTYSIIWTFDQTHGGNPDDPLVLGTDGNFYGTTSLGGTAGTTFKNSGVVFKVTPSGKYTQLYAFCAQANCTDGANPIGGLVQATDGNFYGTTEYGGTGTGGFRQGVVFKLTPAGKLTVLYNFCSLASCKDGSNPFGGLVQASDGNFYGTTVYGGANNQGTIFQITPKGKYTVVHSFQDTKGAQFGNYPEGTLAQNTNGILYGDTLNGGTSFRHQGVFFSLNASLPAFAKLVTWWGKVGATAEILGQGLKGTTSVTFNGTPATFTAVTDTYLTAIVPAGATTGPVSVVTSAGTLTSSHKFFVQPANLTFNPTSGPAGTSVTITGTGLTGATKVTFGGILATAFTVDSDTQITATVPVGAITGKILVTTPGGTTSSAASFTVTP